jgi:hypothetical protein
MPIRKVVGRFGPRRQLAIEPDLVPGDTLPIRVLIAMEDHDVVPPNFSSLPVAEQERIKARIRFRGIRLRHDLKDQHVPLNREVMDIP